jgi:rRNA processing protein Gar1
LNGRSWLDYRQVQNVSHSTESRRATGVPQPPVLWVQRVMGPIQPPFLWVQRVMGPIQPHVLWVQRAMGPIQPPFLWVQRVMGPIQPHVLWVQRAMGPIQPPVLWVQRAMGPIKPPFLWVPRRISSMIRWSESETNHSIHCCALPSHRTYTQTPKPNKPVDPQLSTSQQLKVHATHTKKNCQCSAS